MTTLNTGDWTVLRLSPGWRIVVAHLTGRLPDDTGWQVDEYQLLDERRQQYRITPGVVLDVDILDAHVPDPRRAGPIDAGQPDSLLGLAWQQAVWSEQYPAPPPEPEPELVRRPSRAPAPVPEPDPEPAPGSSWTRPTTPPRWNRPVNPRDPSPPLPGRRDLKVRRAEYVWLLRTWNEHGRCTMRKFYLREYAAMRQVEYWEGRGVVTTLDVSRYKVKWEALW